MAARHILIPIHDFSHGGTERIAFRLAARWLAEGRQVTILAGAREGPIVEQVPPGARIAVLDPPRPRSVLSRFALGKPMAEAAARLSPDAVFLIGNFHFVLGRTLRHALPRTPIVGKVSNPLTPAALGKGRFARTVAAGWSAGIDVLVAMSAASAREMSSVVPERQVVVIPDPFLDEDTAFAARPGLLEAPLSLLFVGRMEPQKDPLLALAVAGELQRRGLAFSLTMLGSGAMEDRVKSAVATSGLGDLVTVHSHVKDPSPYYRAADILLMTSRFEGVPAVIGEALAHGLPFVATPCSEWIADVARTTPACGAITAGREPGELADALLDRKGKRFPSVGDIDTAIGAHRLGRAARAYMALFDRLVKAHHGLRPS